MFKQILKAAMPSDEVPITAHKQTCETCSWRSKDGVTCEAFPDGIPPAILLGVFDHTTRYVDDDYNDYGLTYSALPV